MHEETNRLAEALKTLGLELTSVRQIHPPRTHTEDFFVLETGVRSSIKLECKKSEAEAISVIINDALSRIPKEGERRCETCRWLTHSPGISIKVCGAPHGEMTTQYIKDPRGAEAGTRCGVWQRIV